MQECSDNQLLLDAFIDNELLSPEAAAVQRHLESCSSCAVLLEDLLTLKKALRELPQEQPSPLLKARILKRLAREKKGRIKAWSGRLVRPLAIGVAAALVAVVVLWQIGVVRLDEPIYSSVLADHLRQLSPATTTDMVSEDPEALWRWLNERASFPVPPSLVSRSRLVLVGGRVTTMNGEEMVSIRYQLSREQASLYAMKGHAPMPASARRRMVKGMPLYIDRYQGYNVVMWKEGGLLVCAVSALSRDSLIEMVVEAHPGRPLEV